MRPNATYESGNDKDDGEHSSKHSIGTYVAVSDRRHGDKDEVETVPECERFVVGILVKWVAVIFQLHE